MLRRRIQWWAGLTCLWRSIPFRLVPRPNDPPLHGRPTSIARLRSGRAHEARGDQRCHRCRAPPKAQLRVRRFSGFDPRYGSGGRTGALARLIRQRDQPSSRTADFERELSGQDDVDHVPKVRAGLGCSNSHIRPFTGTPGSHPGVGFRERRAIGGSFLPLLPVSRLF